MQYIDFKVQHQTITRMDKYEVVGNSQNYLYARFSFCEEWADIIPTAVFSTNSGKHYGVAIENGECLVPWEVLTGAEFWVGVFGGDRMTTSTTRVPVKPGVKLNASPGVQPTPPAYEILMRELREGVASIDESEEAAENAAAQAAEKAVESAESAAASASAAADASSAKDVVMNALNNIPAGSTVIVNDLTTGGTTAALSAEMGKVLARRPNPNLLHNWYFVNPVNQRGQTEYAGEIGYTIDRWKAANRRVTVTVGDGSVKVSGTSVMGTNVQILGQKFDTSVAGKMVTVSVLVTECNGTFYVYAGSLSYPDGRVSTQDISKPGLYTATGVLTNETGTQEGFVFMKRSAGDVSFSVAAVKLELGDTQTLAHQDEDGNWVLNEIPDYGDELAKCQRYYQLFSSESARPTELADYRPNMRVNPAVGTININDATYYYADAEL